MRVLLFLARQASAVKAAASRVARITASTLVWFLAAICALAGAMVALAQPYAVTRSVSAVPGSATGKAAPMSTTGTTAAFSTEIALALPPASGIRPSLGLAYSSDGGQSSLGFGWSIIGIDYVARSLHNGHLSYRGPSGHSTDDELVFSVFGSGGRLVYVADHGGVLEYRPRRETGSMLKLFFDQSEQTWTVKSKSGAVATLGGPGAIDAARDPSDEVFAWYVSRVVDIEGHEIRYRYKAVHGVLYPSKIEYDIDAFGPGRHPTIDLEWAPSFLAQAPPGERYIEDYRISYQKGYRADLGRWGLSKIDVTAYGESGNAQTRTHELIHRATKTYATGGPEVLKGQANPVEYWPDAAPIGPRTHYAYWDVATGFDTVQSMPDPETLNAGYEQQSLHTSFSYGENGPGVLRNADVVLSMLVDMDGDGDLDQLAVDSPHDHNNGLANEWRWRENRDGRFNPVASLVHLPTSQGFGCEDFRGASRWPEACAEDVLELSKRDVASVGRCADYPRGPSHSIVERELEKTYQRVMDMNGDAAADLVFSRRRGLRQELVVCLNSDGGGGQRRFDEADCAVWFDGPLEVYPRLVEHDSRPPFCHRWPNGDAPRQTRRLVQDLRDLDGDGLVDLVVARGVDATTQDLSIYRGDGSQLARSTDTALRVPACTEVPRFNDYLNGQPSIRCIESWVLDSWDWVDAEHDDLPDFRTQCQTRLLMDLNGDGVQDLVRTQPVGQRSDRLRVPRRVKPLPRQGSGGPISVGNMRAWALPEGCAQASDTSFRYQLGNASGGVEELRHGLPEGTRVLESSVLLTDPPTIHQGEGYSRGLLIDLNGDGTKDLVDGDTWDTSTATDRLVVRLFTGHEFLPQAAWDLCGEQPCGFRESQHQGVTRSFTTNTCDLGINGVQDRHLTRRGLYDLNGDGQVELLDIPGGVGDDCHDTPWVRYEVDRERLNGYNNLASIRSEAGSEQRIRYTQANGFYGNVPFPKWVLYDIVHQDLISGLSQRETFEVEGGVYDVASREFRGFAEVRVDDGRTETATHYRQGELDTGLVYRTELFDADTGETLISRTRIEHEAVEWASTTKDGRAIRRRWNRPVSVLTEVDSDLEDEVVDLVVVDSTAYEYFGGVGDELGLTRAVRENVDLSPADERYVVETYDWPNAPAAPGSGPDDDYVVVSTRTDVFADTGTHTLLGSVERVWGEDCNCGMQPSPGFARLCKVRSPLNVPPKTYEEAFACYDDEGRITRLVGPDGGEVRLAYHPLGRQSYVRRISDNSRDGHDTYFRDYHAATGQPGTVCGPRHRGDPERDLCDRVHYDLFGRLQRVDLAFDYAPAAPRTVVSFDYKDRGAADDPTWIAATFTPGTGSNAALSEKTYYGGWGQILASQNTTASSTVYSKSYYQYNRLLELVAAHAPVASSHDAYLPFEASPAVAHYRYDLLGRMHWVETPETTGRPTRIEFTRTPNGGAHTVVIDPLGHRSESTTDRYNLLSHARNDGTRDLVTRYEWDAAGNLVAIHDPEGAVTSWAYDFAGRLVEMRSPQLARRSFDYDTRGRLRRVTLHGSGSTLDFEYDVIGRLVRETQSGGQSGCIAESGEYLVTDYVYDAGPETSGLLGSTTVDHRNQGIRLVESYRYDAAGRLVRRTSEYREHEGNPLGLDGMPLAKSFGYDDLGRVLSATYGPVAGSPAYTVDYTYDAGGRLTAVTGGPLSASMTYNPDNSVASLTAQLSNLAFRRAFSYDREGRVTDLATRVTSDPSWSHWQNHFTYLDDGRLARHRDSKGFDATYQYDDAGRLKRATGYTVLPDGQPNAAESGAWIDYSYHRNDVLHQVEYANGRNELYVYDDPSKVVLDRLRVDNSPRAGVYEYDYHQHAPGAADGGLCELRGEGSLELRWNPDGSLAQRQSHSTTSFLYDAAGERWSRHDSATGWRTWTMDDQQVRVKDGAPGILLFHQKHIALPGGVTCTVDSAAGDRCHFGDGQNVVATFDANSGRLRSRWQHMPYGQKRVVTGPEELSFTYKGGEQIGCVVSTPESAESCIDPAEQEAVHFGARDYDAFARRWLSSDPIPTESPYGFVDADPINLVDPTGLLPEHPGGSPGGSIDWFPFPDSGPGQSRPPAASPARSRQPGSSGAAARKRARVHDWGYIPPELNPPWYPNVCSGTCSRSRIHAPGTFGEPLINTELGRSYWEKKMAQIDRNRRRALRNPVQSVWYDPVALFGPSVVTGVVKGIAGALGKGAMVAGVTRRAAITSLPLRAERFVSEKAARVARKKVGEALHDRLAELGRVVNRLGEPVSRQLTRKELLREARRNADPTVQALLHRYLRISEEINRLNGLRPPRFDPPRLW